MAHNCKRLNYCVAPLRSLRMRSRDSLKFRRHRWRAITSQRSKRYPVNSVWQARLKILKQCLARKLPNPRRNLTYPVDEMLDLPIAAAFPFVFVGYASQHLSYIFHFAGHVLRDLVVWLL